jgi:hypothetical protein
MSIITKHNLTYYFYDYGKKICYDDIINWLESNNPIYFRLPVSLLSTDYTGIIKISKNDELILHIKIYEGYYIEIRDFENNIVYYIENSRFPLEIRDYINFNKIDVRYIYDKYVINNNGDNTLDILYRDTVDKKLDFNLKSILKNNMSEHEKNIFNKFTQIIKETKQKVCRHVDNIDNL